MSHEILASVIVNNYNYADFLSSAIDSALGQTYPHVEVVVVDDGSTDGSREVIAGYGQQVVPIFKDNAGQASALNVGFSISKGEILLFLDADDILLPEAVERAVEASRAPGVVKVHWAMWIIDEKGNRTGALNPKGEMLEGDFRDQIIRDGNVRSIVVATSGNAWKRTFLEQVMPIDDCGYKYSADAILCRLAPIYGIVGWVRRPLGCYRLHGRNIFASQDKLSRRQGLIERYRAQKAVLIEHLRRQGVEVNSETWHYRGKHDTWLKQADGIPLELKKCLPDGCSLILVDDNQLESGFLKEYEISPFLERGGQYWGAPADDVQAIAELERLRRQGAGYLLIIAGSFWWLEHYAVWASHLRSQYYCMHEDGNMILFDLGQQASLSSVTGNIEEKLT